jgi:hypothetical protein
LCLQAMAGFVCHMQLYLAPALWGTQMERLAGPLMQFETGDRRFNEYLQGGIISIQARERRVVPRAQPSDRLLEVEASSRAPVASPHAQVCTFQTCQK